MIGIKHVIVTLAGMLGLVLGNVLIDIDHRGPFDCKWINIWREEDCGVHRGILHYPLVMLSIMIFSFGLGFGILIHIIMDFVKFLVW